MSAKATIVAPSNIAFIKYWGARDLHRVIPSNPSISMTLRRCYTRTTVEHLEGDAHEVRWRAGQSQEAGGFEKPPPAFEERVLSHLDHLRRITGSGGAFRVATENSFPAAAGIASSASGFAALTLAVLAALERETSPEECSTLARQSGSGSAARSVFGGYVEWPFGRQETDAYAFPIAPADHWDLRDVVALVATSPKKTSSLDGHRLAKTSRYFRVRQRRLPDRLQEVRQALAARDFERLGEAVETEAVDLHCIAMTSEPPIYYWQPGTLEVLAAVRDLRNEGVGAWSTMDAGPNVHVICQPQDEDRVVECLESLPSVTSTIRDGVGTGPLAENEHLF